MTRKTPSLWQRVGMAADLLSGRAFRADQKAFQFGDGKKPFQFMWPAWREGQAQWRLVDFESYVSEGFNLNSLIYSAIMYKNRSVSYAKLRAYTGDLDNPKPLPPTNPLAQLAARPNPHQSAIEFQQQCQTYLNIAGEAFVVMHRLKPNAIPTAMYSLRPDRVRIIPGDGGIMGFVYVPEGKGDQDGIPILPSDMLHIKFPNPLDPLEGMGHGLSPIAPLAWSADVDNMITEFIKLFFERGAVPPGVLEFQVPLDEDVLQMVKDRWQEQYGGFRNWVDVGVLDRGAKYNRMGLTFDEMGFESLDDRNEARILGPFGVPSILIGTRLGLDRGTESNVEELRRRFWEDTLIPELLLFEVEYQYRVAGVESGEYLLYDFSGVPALQKDMPNLIHAAYELWSMGVPRAIAFQVVGLTVESTEGDDISYLPTNVSTAERINNPPPPPPSVRVIDPGEEDDKPPLLPPGKGGRSAAMPPFQKGKPYTEDQKTYLWYKVDQIAKSWEPEFGEAAAKAFEDNKRGLLAILRTYKQRKASVNWESVEQDWRNYATEAGWKDWRSRFQRIVRLLMEEQGQHWAGVLGIEFDIRNLDGEDWFNQYMLVFADPINETTLNSLHDLTSQALSEGWSIQTMSNHLEQVFEQWMTGNLSKEDFEWFLQRMPPWRRELIARVETMRASNSGSHQLFTRWGVRFKEWLATRDGRVRDTHKRAGTMYSAGGDPGPIPLSQPFQVGAGQMMHPLDSSLGAPLDEIMGCRCTELPFMPD